MEIMDSGYELVREVIATHDTAVAFHVGVHVLFCLPILIRFHSNIIIKILLYCRMLTLLFCWAVFPV